MKRLLIPAFVALILASCGLMNGSFAWPWKAAKTIEKAPLDGTVRLFNEHRQLDRVLRYECGVLSGPAYGYWPSGSLKWQVNYLSGKKHGIQRMYFENGKLRSEAPYIDGKMSGVVTEYDLNGRLLMEIPVKDGRISGQVVRYHYGTPAPVKPESRSSERLRRGEAPESAVEDACNAECPMRNTPRCRHQVRGQENPDSLVDADAMLGEQDVPECLPDGGPFEVDKSPDSRGRAVFSSRWADEDRVDASASRYTGRDPRDAADFRTCGDPRFSRVDKDDRDARETRAPRGERLRPFSLRDDVGERDLTYGDNPSCVRGSGCPYHGRSRDARDDFWDLKTPTAADQKTDLRPSLRDAYADQPLPKEVTRRDSELPASPSGTRRRAPIFTEDDAPRAAAAETRDDPDALSRELLLRQWDRKGKSPSGNTVLVRQSESGTEYLVYPDGGLRDNEAWRVRLLRRGLDPNEAIRRGI